MYMETNNMGAFYTITILVSRVYNEETLASIQYALNKVPVVVPYYGGSTLKCKNSSY